MSRQLGLREGVAYCEPEAINPRFVYVRYGATIYELNRELIAGRCSDHFYDGASLLRAVPDTEKGAEHE